MILVTGAGGVVSSALLDALHATGRPTRAAYHAARDADRARAEGSDAVVVDLADPATLGPALDGVDTVFLLGAMSPGQTRQELNVLDAATAAGVRRVVKLSVWRADEELTPIARLHRPVERALAASGLAYTLLRPNFYMQNFTRMMAGSIRDGGEFAQQSSDAPVGFVDARDIARVAAHVLTSDGHDGRIYDITGPEALTYREAAEVLSVVLDRPVRFVGLSDERMRERLLGIGLPEFYADSLVAVGRAFRDGGTERITGTVAELTGRAPLSFEHFVREHRAVFE